MVCWNCNKELTDEEKNEEIFYFWGRRYCAECKKVLPEQEAKERAEYIRLKKSEMYKKALHILEMQNVKMYDYKEAAEVVREKLEKEPDKFDSSYEVITAIVLVKNRIYSKPQYKIGRYQVDFLLPEIGVVLEIDGDRHRYNKVRDNNREIDIRNALGPGWDIIRIKTTWIDKKAEAIPEAINKAIDYRQNVISKWRNPQ